MKAEESDAMRSLDARLAKLYAGLDTRPGFEDRLQARIVRQARVSREPQAADALARIEGEHQRARAAADRAARVDELALAVAGLGGVAAVLRYAPELTHWYAAAVGRAGPAVVAFATLAVSAAALWVLLRYLEVDPRSFVGT